MTKNTIVESVDDHELVAPFVTRRNELMAQRTELATKHTELLQRWRGMKTDVSLVDEPPVIAAAHRLAFGVDRQPQKSTETQILEITAEIKKIDTACGLLVAKIESGRNQASYKICDEKRAEHNALEQKMVGSFVSMANAVIEYQSFVDDLQDAGIRTTALSPIYPDFLGPMNCHEPLAQFLAEAVKRNSLSPSSIPAKLR